MGQHQQEQLPTSPDVGDPFTAPLPWRQEASSLPQQPSSSTFTDLPADLAELISDNGFGASLGEVPRSNSAPADMSYNNPKNMSYNDPNRNNKNRPRIYLKFILLLSSEA